MPVLQVMRAAGEDLGRVGGIGAAVPGEEAAGDVAVEGVEFFAQKFAADGEAGFGFAELREKRTVETDFAGDLPHDLHQAPGKSARVGFGSRDLIIGVKIRDIFGEEARLVAHGPGIPGRFLFDDGADEGGIERLRGGGFAGEGDELGGGGHWVGGDA